MSIFDFFTREAGQERRRALEGLLTQFIPPEMRPQLGLLAEANPVVSMERAGQDAQQLFAPDQSLMDRLAAGGRMASNMAGTVAPAMVAGRAGVPVANAVAEGLTGMSMTPQAAALRDFGVDESGALRLFHGSPHDFDRFSLDKIGTGEGNQSFGYGLYFAENPEVAQRYRELLSSGNPLLVGRVRDVLARNNGDEAAAKQWIESAINATSGGDKAFWAKALNDFDALKNFSGGKTYEVNINANPEDFVDFDVPIMQQQRALEALQPIIGNVSNPGYGVKAAIDDASRYLGYADDPRRGEDLLREAGIPGIRYLDAGSRGAGDGSRNYVVFDENLIEIVRKYGIAGAAAMLGMSQADVAQAMQQQPQPQGLLAGPQ